MTQGIDPDSLLILPTEATRAADEATERRQKLAQVYEGQRYILEELTKAIPDLDANDKEVADKDRQIKLLDQQINEIQKLILQELTSNSNSKPTCSDVLYDILTSTQRELLSLCENATENGETSTHLTNILSIENSLTQRIGALTQAGQYPMTPEQMQERRDANALHNEKVVAFLKELKDKESPEDN